MNSGLVCNARYERLIRETLPKYGVSVIICIDSTVLGPALGGMRFKLYESLAEADTDAVRLGCGMTYKAAMLWPDYKLGGGKAVIVGDPATQKTPVFLREYGRIVERLGGAYITAEDMNTNVEDMRIVATQTSFVVGKTKGEHGSSGNPAPYTAEGCLAATRAALKHHFGSEEFRGRRFVFQGAGEVGFRLARLSSELGARIVACDSEPEKIRRMQSEVAGVEIVGVDEIYSQQGDVFVPSAVGGILNDETIPFLQCPIVSGPANNQLADPVRHGVMLMGRGIVYVVDFIGNAGGLIAAADELLPGRFTENRVRRNLRKISGRIEKNLAISAREKRPPHDVAVAMCEQLIAQVRQCTEAHLASVNEAA